MVPRQRSNHQVKTGNRARAGSGFHDLKPGAERVRRRMARARNQSVRIARFQHERAEKGCVFRLFLCLLLRHAFRFSQFVQKRGVTFEFGGSLRIDKFDPRKIDIGIGSMDLVRIAEKYDLRKSFLRALLRRFDNAPILSFAKHDGALSGFRPFFNRADDRPAFRKFSAELFHFVDKSCHIISPENLYFFLRIVYNNLRGNIYRNIIHLRVKIVKNKRKKSEILCGYLRIQSFS